ncbi:hypothetical protein BGZ61DRAFT_442052 [Ilyonectria robusta]|uniref:uncharacterized protein n=1 Tax=Ilyonectria robusta TaxID=1079257 RepID=UPI001E8D4DD9|nr:uncharacterized protein BGZ61DRAFT_442052 [Ilyonectria robusta]KAH8736472.1 hypothetical protein BGZ61DRAFT_442052 [Ilyonectria robusta]
MWTCCVPSALIAIVKPMEVVVLVLMIAIVGQNNTTHVCPHQLAHRQFRENDNMRYACCLARVWSRVRPRNPRWSIRGIGKT